jgi:hypothetical protein
MKGSINNADKGMVRTETRDDRPTTKELKVIRRLKESETARTRL